MISHLWKNPLFCNLCRKFVYVFKRQKTSGTCLLGKQSLQSIFKAKVHQRVYMISFSLSITTIICTQMPLLTDLRPQHLVPSSGHFPPPGKIQQLHRFYQLFFSWTIKMSLFYRYKLLFDMIWDFCVLAIKMPCYFTIHNALEF